MKPRFQQAVLILTFLPLCWLMMQAVHELGHVAAALATGGRVEKVVLHPLRFSRTDVNPNPHPLVVVWAGPLIGAVLPLAAYALIWRWRGAGRRLLQFFAGFCCIANGAYIGFGAASEGMDTQIMIELGCLRWQLLAFSIPAIAVGLWLLNATGSTFGIGVPGGRVSPRLTLFSVAMLVVVVVIELAAFSG